MVEHRLLAENESVQFASQANALPPWMGKDITPSGLSPGPDRDRLVQEWNEGQRCPVIF